MRMLASEVLLPDMDKFYSPEKIDQVLRSWPAYVSQAENIHSTLPEALRPSKGRAGDSLRHADILADLTRAVLATVEVDSLEWRLIEGRTRCLSFGMMAVQLRIPKTTIYRHYEAAVLRIALFLGWQEEPSCSNGTNTPTIG